MPSPRISILLDKSAPDNGAAGVRIVKMGQLNNSHVGDVIDMLESRSSARSCDGSAVSLGDVMEFAEASAHSLQNAVSLADSPAYAALSQIGAEIGAMKSEISKLQLHDVKNDRIPEAGQELDAIVEATEDATNTIMESAEQIMEADPSNPEAYAELVNDKIMQIFEACSFQDITGQRISKVVKTIDHIDKRVTQFIEQLGLINPDAANPDTEVEETAEEKRVRELILHGPQMKGEGVSQNDVDAMLDADSGSDQSEIDRLFG